MSKINGMHTLKIDGVSYKVPAEVADLVMLISVERDDLKSKLEKTINLIDDQSEGSGND